ncbi:hypothetical protein YYC_00591 [Plasmodium yoelii 17X]|uniref:Uncharacterized protein n=1 Tax=Plasmodium yoelii 17X TaxID=1323249 RepID=V7PWI9_PLAYE|nr:hypothetical protein YYC_00591 [Plasmodium yoelii 17X]
MCKKKNENKLERASNYSTYKLRIHIPSYTYTSDDTTIIPKRLNIFNMLILFVEWRKGISTNIA